MSSPLKFEYNGRKFIISGKALYMEQAKFGRIEWVSWSEACRIYRIHPSFVIEALTSHIVDLASDVQAPDLLADLKSLIERYE